MLLERDAEDDKAKGTSMLGESLQISSDLGMRPLMERELSRREILKAQAIQKINSVAKLVNESRILGAGARLCAPTPRNIHDVYNQNSC